MKEGGRALSAAVFVLVGGLGVISSGQPWLGVRMHGADGQLDVSGASALPTLAPLSLTVLALAGALAISGLVLRYVFAGLGVLVAIWLLVATLPLLVDPPLSAVASTLTEHTGLAGEQTLASMVERIVPTGWPYAAAVLWVLLLLGSVFAALTVNAWRGSGRRFRTDAPAASGPLDAIDSWDDLSRGSDPTAPER